MSKNAEGEKLNSDSIGNVDVIGEKENPNKLESLENNTFKIGSYVRATYIDGFDYEAKIVELNGKTAIIRYVGYGTKQDFPVEQLVPSWGKEERKCQYIYAKEESKFSKKIKTKASKKKLPKINTVPLSSVPSTPPFPPLPHDFHLDNDHDNHLAVMLMAWYMTGYYTGLYQGAKNGKAINQGSSEK